MKTDWRQDKIGEVLINETSNADKPLCRCSPHADMIESGSRWRGAYVAQKSVSGQSEEMNRTTWHLPVSSTSASSGGVLNDNTSGRSHIALPTWKRVGENNDCCKGSGGSNHHWQSELNAAMMKDGQR